MLVAGAAAPTLVTEEMVATMKEGSVIVDVAVDQGGCIETIHATTHADPIYVVYGVVHYGVANMPGAVPAPRPSRSPTRRCPTRWSLPRRGVQAAVRRNPALARGVNVWRGRSCTPAVAHALGEKATALEAVLD